LTAKAVRTLENTQLSILILTGNMPNQDNKRVKFSALENLKKFAALIFDTDGSEESLGNAVMEAVRSLNANAAALYKIDNDDWVLLAEYGHSQEHFNLDKSVDFHPPHPFVLSAGSQKPKWINANKLPTSTKTETASTAVTGILPCCFNKKTSGLITLVFNDQTIVKSSIKTAANLLSTFTAQALEQLHKMQVLKNQAGFAVQLLAMASHDLRNPLNTIRLGTELLELESEAEGVTLKALPIIDRAIDQAVSIIDTLNDFTRTQIIGEIPIHRRFTSIAIILKGVLEDLQIQAPNRHFECDASGNLEGYWDEDRMRQVLFNLIFNAHCYAPLEETIHIGLDGLSDPVYLTVKNFRPVISAEKIQSLFEPMNQADKSSLTAKGLGLGLYIVRHIVTAHQGRVWVTSNEQSGTIFTVELPRNSSANSNKK
jgi:signal transduction histidine kinase